MLLEKNSSDTKSDDKTIFEGGLLNQAVLSLGSNMGDRLLMLRESLQHLEYNPEIEIKAVSSIYETDPVGYIDQPAFYNIAVEILTSLSPDKLLNICQQIEKQFHRERKVRWGPRTIDIDIITYENLKINTPDLTIPHPRMYEREFVLLPIKELETGEIQVSENVRPIYSHWY